MPCLSLCNGARAREARRVTEIGHPLMREIVVVTSVYVRLPVRADSGGAGGESQDDQTGEGSAI